MAKDNLDYKLKQIKLLILDIDGVLTDGNIYFGPNGEEIKVFNTHDGQGIRIALHVGLNVTWLSGRKCSAIEKRAADLGIKKIYLGIRDKLRFFQNVLDDFCVEYSQVAYVGDDLPDLPLLKLVGLAMSPSDAVPEVREFVHYVASKPGGKGSVREIIELILKAQGKWSEEVGAIIW